MKKFICQSFGRCFVLLVVVLSGCTELKKTFGVERQPPNELQILQKLPLTVPPEFHLSPPQPGQELEPYHAKASAANLLGQKGAEAKGGDSDLKASSGEKVLLAHAPPSDPNVRAELPAPKEGTKEYLFPSLVEEAPKKDVLNPEAESMRLFKG